ncbi:MAG: hypothetical protein KF868_20350 [Acidobacteria bacterium]|nr:hypothetical protein [Acidobacteriota bacterium]MCW5969655.1 hypothetical protein [Blastocatellales bacterium]
MKKFSILTVCALLAGLLALPMGAFAQQQPKFKSEEEQKLYSEYYNACNVEKNKNKCFDLAKTFLEKHSDSDYAPYAKSTIINTLGENFQGALGAFYQGDVEAGKLDKLISTGEEYLKWQPDNAYVSAQMALAACRAVLAQVSKDLPRAKRLAEKAIQQMDSTTPGEGWSAEQWTPLRENVMAQGNQYLGYYELEQPTPDLEAAIRYLTLSTEVRNKDGLGWKDPNNYWLRASAYQRQYAQLSEQYRALSDEQKTGDEGKALLDRINPIIDKMIDDYARVCATAKNPGAASLRDAAMQTLNDFWKYRYKNIPDGQIALVRHFDADPLVSAPERTPAAAESNLDESAPPTGVTATPKLAAGSGNQPGGANGSKTGASKGGASKTTKKPAAKKPTPRKRG